MPEAWRRSIAKQIVYPRGTPMSMAVIALLKRAWIVQMKQYVVSPRVLADELQLISTGERHLEHFEYAFCKTWEHASPRKNATHSLLTKRPESGSETTNGGR